MFRDSPGVLFLVNPVFLYSCSVELKYSVLSPDRYCILYSLLLNG